ncbi:GOLPH3/VPS74 family protein [Streptomyces collinus]|uniref:GOLPH3/VPS74 family protein n=1 Tax=Streptomyces collinus TaxID=42684 RepID=UPI0036C739E3
MTTPQDLFIVATDVPGDRPVEQGDLSLALAGAELIDLLGARALTLDDERIVPGPPPALGDRLLDEAGAALVRREPYETVEDWLWRRGEGLTGVYLDDLDARGQLTGERRHWLPYRPKADAAAGTEARRHATGRWESHEPVLAGLAAALGLGDGGQAGEGLDEAVVTVLAAVNHALTELEGVRQRRRIENAAFDNIWRAPG